MYNFETICRTCSSNGQLQPLFNNYPFNVADMLNEIVNITVLENDNYPQNICKTCLDKLYFAYNFKQQCQDIQKKYDDYLNNLDSENKFDINNIEEQIYLIVKEEEEDELLEDNDDEEKKNIKSEYLETHSNQKSYTCETCQKVFTRNNNYKRHLRVHTGEKFVCPICGGSFTNLSHHLQTHKHERRFKCEICNTKFAKNSNYRRHLRIHTGEKFPCTLCERSFARIESLKAHIRAHQIHPDEENPQTEKKFLCSTCGKGFTQEKALKDHINLHTGARPHKCKICENTYATQSVLWKHQNMHSGIGFKSRTPEKPKPKRFKCTYCEKTFALKSSRINHENVHTGVKPFNCKICNERFRQTNHLVVHMRTHTGEKPYKCSFCDKRFAIKGNLTVHERIHTGEAPYVCDICTKGFTDSKRLKKHKLKYHSLTAIEEQKINKESFDLDFVKIDKSFVQE